MNPAPTLYLLPGLIGDKRVFAEFRELVQPLPTRCLEWVLPHPHQGFPEYARRLAQQIDPEDHPIFLGISLGGMISLELQALFPESKVVLVSSVKGYHELPQLGRRLRAAGALPLFPVGALKRFLESRPPQSVQDSPEKQEKYRQMIRSRPDGFIKWAVDAGTRWERIAPAGEVFHLHGTADRLFPVKNIRNYLPINGGGHFMMADRAEEIALALRQQFPEWWKAYE